MADIALSALPLVTTAAPTDTIPLDVKQSDSTLITSRISLHDLVVASGASGGASSGGASSPSGYDALPKAPSPFDDEFNGATLDPKWTIINSAPGNALRSVKIDTVLGQAIFDSPYSTQDRAFGIVQTAPTGAFSLTVKMGRVTGGSNYHGPMIFLGGPTNARYLFGSLNQSSFGGPITYGMILNADQSIFNDNITPNYNLNPLAEGYYRITVDAAGNILYYYSRNGSFLATSTLLIGNHAASVVSGITTIGVGMHPFGDRSATYCDWFRVTQP